MGERDIMNTNTANANNQNQVMPVYLGVKRYISGNSVITDTYFKNPKTGEIWRDRQIDTYKKI